MSENRFINSARLANAVKATGYTPYVAGVRDPTFTGSLTGDSGALHMVADIYGSPDQEHDHFLGTLTIDVDDVAVDGDGVDDFWIKTSWAWMRADITELTGDGAAATIRGSN